MTHECDRWTDILIANAALHYIAWPTNYCMCIVTVNSEETRG